jgi:predicted SprT family Zn-dependent metalloprotease
MTTKAANRSRQEVLDFMAAQVEQVISILANEGPSNVDIIADMYGLELTLDTATRRLGAAWFRGKQAFKISLSYKWARHCPADVLLDTMRHELAHVAAGRDAGHGPLWQKFARKFCAEPNATYTDDWRPQLKYNHICEKCQKNIGGSDRKWRIEKQHRGCGGRVLQIPHGEDMKKVRPITAVEETPAGDTPAEPRPIEQPPKTRKTAGESSKESKAKQKAKNPELYNRIQSLASKVSRLKKDPSKHGELFLIKEELKKLRAEFAAL